MKTILLIACAFLPGCVTISLDVPTKLGRATFSTDGKSVSLGLSK